ncbi:MAG TPA: hypothetical protein VJ864_18025 [Candidatus Binatia bacterium]|jgi:hypothetical protein|nr:hypothetical protein [Candidatus Binatia bacterium]
MPEISRFFGIIIRMFVELAERITRLTSTPITKIKWESSALTG